MFLYTGISFVKRFYTLLIENHFSRQQHTFTTDSLQITNVAL